LEAGLLALQDWSGDVIDVRQTANGLNIDPWTLCRALACVLAGPDPADTNGPYSRALYEQYASVIDPAPLAKYETIYVDSITVASRFAFAWAKRQPEAHSEKTGKPDTRGAYGLLGQEMVKWLTTLQHIPNKSVVVVGILDRMQDDLGRVTWEPQVEGGKTARELPGIFDQVLTLQLVNGHRAFVTNQNNEFGYPAKDRSGRLAPIEPPDLGALMRKIQNANRLDKTITTTLPATAE
jgi:hypothetical protein